MKIVAPASSIEDIAEYNKLGIEEIYLGVNDLAKEEHENNKWDSVNKRFEKKANFENLEEIKEVNKINRLAEKPAELSLTLNRSFYNPKQLTRAKEQVLILKDYIDNFIVSELSMIKFLKENAPNNGIILSCIGVCLNSKAVNFYKNLGIKKIVLPRHLSIEELKSLTSNNPEIEFEVMILNQFCRNLDGFCSRCHIPEHEVFTTTCNVPFEQKIHFINEYTRKDEEIIQENTSTILKKFNPFCGICSIKELEEIGVKSLKIVGRNNDHIRKINDARLIKKTLSLLSLNSEEYKTKCKELFQRYYQFECKNNCYY